MDECAGKITTLPCCLSWIRHDYGIVGSVPLHELWNSEGAQHIRWLIVAGRQYEICDRYCPYLLSGKYGESSLRVVNGPPLFVENQLLNNQEIRERRTILRSQPMLLKALPTLRCNLRCSMCFQNKDNPVELDDSAWDDIYNLLPYVYEITFQGGEVTLDKRFRSFLDSQVLKLHQQVRISIITNGTIIDNNLFNTLSEINLSSIVVSINAAKRKTYENITKKDMFNKVLYNLRRLIQLSRDHKKYKFDVFASFVIMQSNFTELPLFIRLVNKLGANLQLLHVIGNENDEDIFSKPSQQTLLKETLDIALKISKDQANEQVRRIKAISADTFSVN